MTRFSPLLTAVFCALLPIGSYSETAEKADAREARVFPELEQVTGDRVPQYKEFLKIVDEHRDVFSMLAHPQSEAHFVLLAYAPNMFVTNAYNPDFHSLLIGNSGCPTGQEHVEDIAVQIHEYAHSVFEPGFRARLADAISATAGNEKARRHGANPALLLAQTAVLDQPFNELFADTATVLILNDPQALSRHFEACYDFKGMRDFSIDYPVKGWNVGPLDGDSDRRHEVLNPVRSHIWKVWTEKFSKQQKGAAKILAAVFDVSIAMIRELADQKTTYVQCAALDQEKLNRDFLERFDRQLAAY